jgi:hypothetical protein
MPFPPQSLIKQIDSLFELRNRGRISRTIRENFDNINRMPPVRLTPRPPQPSGKKVTDPLPLDYVSIPTEAESDYYQNGIQLPQKAENLEKLFRDMERTGRFDNELCYMLRKQETLDDLKDLVKAVWDKRRSGDEDFCKQIDATRFNNVLESVLRRWEGRELFRESFIAALEND